MRFLCRLLKFLAYLLLNYKTMEEKIMKTLIAFGAVLTLTLGSVTFAADSEKAQPKDDTTEKMERKHKMTREERNKMANAHKKMADCLLSERPMKECHTEMESACHEAMGSNCPMGHHHHRSKRHEET